MNHFSVQSRPPIPFVLILLAFMCAGAHAQRPCDTCGTVAAQLGKWQVQRLTDTSFQITTTSHEVLVDNVRSLHRATVHVFGRPRQALRVFYGTADTCRDTTLPLNGPLVLYRGSLGPGSQPIEIPVLPACEFVAEEPSSGSRLFFGLAGFGAYAGNDTSHRETGFDSFTGGARAYIGLQLSEHFDGALGVEGFAERARMRLPVFAHLRYAPFGGERIESYCRYAPSECQFKAPEDVASRPDDPRYQRADASVTCDNTVYFVEDQRRIAPGFRPFLFIEGGVVLNGGFEGAGARPSLNPDDYGQYLGAAGIGLPIGPVVLAAGYRYLRLNHRTPCETCPGQFVVNTNVVHAFALSIGVEFR